MRFRRVRLPVPVLLGVLLAVTASLAQTNFPSSPGHVRKPAGTGPPFETGSVTNGIYHHHVFGVACKVPPGWVLRTEEMNAQDENEPVETQQVDPQKASPALTKADEKNPDKMKGRVLLAAFSRPPQAMGEDVNSSILIVAESVAAYPGLKDAVQYFGPVTEVAKGQGFAAVNGPYEFPVSARTLVRADFQKNVGSRVVRQSTLVMLTHGYALSFTFIAGTEEEAEELIDGLSLALARNTAK